MFGNVVKIGLIMLFSVNVFAGKIDKAYEALKIYDYFKAKSLFQEVLEDEPVAARYGLTIIYYRNDNPFHNLDTAYSYIQKVEVNFEELRNKDKDKLLNYSIDSDKISNLKNNIVLAFWNNTKDTKSVRSLTAFIKKFPEFYDIENVIQIRTDLSFDNTEEENTFQSYGSFLKTYPDDPRAEDVKLIYEKKLYEAKTENGDLQSYIDFIYIYPENPYIIDAEDQIFILSTKNKTAKSYKWFVDKFPDNPNTAEAWSNLFILSFTDFNDNEIRDFIQNNHDFPFPKIFSEARVLRDLELYQMSRKGKWGFISSEGEIIIEPKYEFENNFSNELALVANEDYVGYVNKKGEQVIDFIYDDGGNFIQGVAHVIKGDSLALINKLGNKILDFKYSEISDPKEGIVLAKKIKNNKYSYYSVLGKEIFKGQEFAFAEPFIDDFAIIGDGSNYGIINLKGEVVVEINNQKIYRDIEDRFRIQNSDSKYGIISLTTNDTIIPFNYDDIGAYSEGKYSVFLDKNYGYYREDGSILTKTVYKRFKGDVEETSFNGNFALTNIREKYGIIDSLGNKVFPNIFEEIGDIAEYPVPCKKRGNWGFVTKNITLWLPYKYSYAGAFRKGQAIVAKNGKYGVINNKKKIVISFGYKKISDFKEDFYLAVKNNKYGILDRKGKVILPFYYSNITELKGDIIALNYKDEIYYYNIKRNIFVYGSFPK